MTPNGFHSMRFYSSLALLYDALMAEADYEAWAFYLHDLMQRFGAPGTRLLDVACGTGSMTLELSRLGYTVAGIDISCEMLAVAADKGFSADLDLGSWMEMDMRSLSLPEDSYDIAVCSLDGFNYLSDEAELDATLAGLKRILAPGGLLLFDMHSEYKLRQVLNNGVFFQETEAGLCVWTSQFDEESDDALHELTLFVPEQGELWRRYDESHRQHYFPEDTVRAALSGNGFELLALLPWGEKTNSPWPSNCERLQYVARAL